MPPDASPLLQTKLAIPPPRRHLLPRARLIARLRGAEDGLVLLSAPAGFGKTTLLAAWCRALAAEGRAVAWLSLEPADNDLPRFLAYLRAALAGLPLGDDPPPVDGAIEATLTPLLNALAALDREIVLALDDYHHIHAPGVHMAVSFLLEHLPPRIRLAIGSRADPPLPLARLRVRGRLTELRAADLRFTPEETGTFLAERGVALGPEALADVMAYAEGWPAGVQLMTLALERAGATRHPFDAGQADLFAYLADDVFAGQPAHRKSFLLQTSILDELCGPLCDAVLGLADADGADSYSRLVLDELDHANLFVAPIDGQRRWFRYHQLFRAFLRERLDRELPEGVAALHARASAWYARHGRIEPAVAHALAAGEPERARQLAGRLSGEDGDDPAETAGAPAEPLSEREREVLRLVAAGSSNHEIAETLVISLGTVKSHLNHILGKLAVHSRTQAIARARELGLLDTPASPVDQR